MTSKESSLKRQNTITRVVCTFVFTLFTFFYLYYFQADLLTVMQHVFSKGQTHYEHFVGAVLITVVLTLIQVGVVKLVRRLDVLWALTFVPSAVCLTLLTDACPQAADGLIGFGSWVYVAPAVLIAYVLILWGSYKSGFAQAFAELTHGNARQLWVNLLVLLAVILMVCVGGNTDRTYHARIHAEQCLMDNNPDGALKTLKELGGSDENVTMLTAYALAQKNALADKLFEYRLNGGSRALMPDGDAVKFEILPDSSFYVRLGGWYVQRMTTMKYLDYQRRHKRMNHTAADYLLCGYLMDGNLDAFAACIGKYYAINDSTPLPKHYREALTLYTHLHSAPRIIYRSNVMDADFQDYQKLENSVKKGVERRNMLRDTYGNTYWYYYQYGR